jgi:hypothetical protein
LTTKYDTIEATELGQTRAEEELWTLRLKRGCFGLDVFIPGRKADQTPFLPASFWKALRRAQGAGRRPPSWPAEKENLLLAMIA